MTINLTEMQACRDKTAPEECIKNGGHYPTYWKGEQPGYSPIPPMDMYDCLGCLTTVAVPRGLDLPYVGMVSDPSDPQITHFVYKLI
ncbi:MAG: hypothetical protein HY364_01425 [Candidatus Aenigmarchaeota archaeon]|nr:hypothetical protein [Candidatus Aenigmarchaeota archaeon]